MSPSRGPLKLAVATAGIPYAVWRYAGVELEIRKQTSTCPWPMSGFPGDACDYEVDCARMQRPSAGHGPAFHRRYAIEARDPVMTPEQLLAVIAADPDAASPRDLARFAKRRGGRGGAQVGDEYEIVLPGPWNGPVRVIDRTSRSFRFATLEGHMEAGEIEFRAEPTDAGLRFEIESWARSADPVFHLLYHRLKVSMEIQQHMWAQFLQRAARVSGGVPGPISIDTRRCDEPNL